MQIIICNHIFITYNNQWENEVEVALKRDWKTSSLTKGESYKINKHSQFKKDFYEVLEKPLNMI
jgi:hypothetical protein